MPWHAHAASSGVDQWLPIRPRPQTFSLCPPQNLCWSNIWSAMYHTPGELSLTDPGGAYLLYFLFQAFYSGTWPSLPSKYFYSSSGTNITLLIPGPNGMGKLTSQFGEIAADQPGKAYTLAGSYTLPGVRPARQRAAGCTSARCARATEGQAPISATE